MKYRIETNEHGAILSWADREGNVETTRFFSFSKEDKDGLDKMLKTLSELLVDNNKEAVCP